MNVGKELIIKDSVNMVKQKNFYFLDSAPLIVFVDGTNNIHHILNRLKMLFLFFFNE